MDRPRSRMISFKAIYYRPFSSFASPLTRFVQSGPELPYDFQVLWCRFTLSFYFHRFLRPYTVVLPSSLFQQCWSRSYPGAFRFRLVYFFHHRSAKLNILLTFWDCLEARNLQRGRIGSTRPSNLVSKRAHRRYCSVQVATNFRLLWPAALVPARNPQSKFQFFRPFLLTRNADTSPQAES